MALIRAHNSAEAHKFNIENWKKYVDLASIRIHDQGLPICQKMSENALPYFKSLKLWRTDYFTCS